MAERIVKLGSLAPGLNNRLEPTQLDTTLPDRSKGTYLYGADNVDINSKGYLQRRRGTTRRITGATHSVWGDGGHGYAVIDGAITHLLAPTMAATPVVTGMTDQPVRYVRAPDGMVYWTDSMRIGRLLGAAALELVTQTPNPVPGAAATSGGLPPGRYQVCFTALGSDGESGSTPPVQIDLPDGGGIAFTGLQAGTLIYATGPNGEVFNEIPFGDFLTLDAFGAPCHTLLLQPMPAGQLIAVHKGSLVVARGSILYVSEPYRYGLFNPSRGYIPLPAPITVAQPCEDGMFVCADKTYWLAGDPLDSSLVSVAPYGGLLGGSGFIEDDQTAYWQSPQGIVLGKPGGAVSTPQDRAIAFGSAAGGATLFRQKDGMRQLIAARLDVGPPTSASESFLRYDAHRKEIQP